MNWSVNYGRCMNCGEKLPPPSAAAHQCLGVAAFAPSSPFGGWSEQAIRRIAYEVVQEVLAAEGKSEGTKAPSDAPSWSAIGLMAIVDELYRRYGSKRPADTSSEVQK
jgi:hypothetical protein